MYEEPCIATNIIYGICVVYVDKINKAMFKWNESDFLIRTYPHQMLVAYAIAKKQGALGFVDINYPAPFPLYCYNLNANRSTVLELFVHVLLKLSNIFTVPFKVKLT